MDRIRKTTKTTFKVNTNVDSAPPSKKPRVLTFINNTIDTMATKPIHSKTTARELYGARSQFTNQMLTKIMNKITFHLQSIPISTVMFHQQHHLVVIIQTQQMWKKS